MDFAEILKRRTVRFFEQKRVSEAMLMEMIDAACLASCAANKQELRYRIVHTPALVEKVFAETRYAGLVAPRRSPVWGVNAPDCFIAVSAERDTGFAGYEEVDAGAAIQSMEFAAFNQGLGCCWIGAFNRENVARLLGFGTDERILYLLAVGYPAETPQVERIGRSESVAYYIDGDDVLHVPKYSAEAVTRVL